MFIKTSIKERKELARLLVDRATVYHPEASGQVEHANGLILQGIKTRIYNELKIHVGRWLDYYSLVLTDH